MKREYTFSSFQELCPCVQKLLLNLMKMRKIPNDLEDFSTEIQFYTCTIIATKKATNWNRRLQIRRVGSTAGNFDLTQTWS